MVNVHEEALAQARHHQMCADTAAHDWRAHLEEAQSWLPLFLDLQVPIADIRRDLRKDITSVIPTLQYHASMVRDPRLARSLDACAAQLSTALLNLDRKLGSSV